MIYKELDWDVDYEAMGCEKPPRQSKLTTYIPEYFKTFNPLWPAKFEWQKRPAVIVCPGGGYCTTCATEGEAIALKYCSAGFHAFVLDYAVKPAGWPSACCELSKAVAYVRSIADEYGIDKDKVFVCGFSAGGHLAASLGVHYANEDVRKFSGIKADENKPNGMILGYPVLTDIDTSGTKDNFIAKNEKAADLFSLEKHVTSETVPTFLWHTYTDELVSVAGSIAFLDALQKHNVPCEAHIYAQGPHGLGLATRATSISGGVLPIAQGWIDASIDWINNL